MILNLLLRLTIFYFLFEVLLFPDDPRFAHKAIPIRNFIIVVTFSLLLPFLYWLMKRWKNYPLKKWTSYPWGFDNLYLSIFWLDMAGNSLNLYDTYYFFDLIPHFASTGAMAVVFTGALGFSPLGGIALGSIIHTLLEAQEYYTDVFAQTINVRGTSDTINDLLAGIAGMTIFMLIYLWKQKRYVQPRAQKRLRDR